MCYSADEDEDQGKDLQGSASGHGFVLALHTGARRTLKTVTTT